MNNWLVVFVCLFCTVLQGQSLGEKGIASRCDTTGFTAIDEYVRKCPEEAMETVEALSYYLGQVTTTDIQKTRAIYMWLAEFVAYDDRAINRGKVKKYSVAKMLKRRKGVCADFSNLFLVLGEKMGLTVVEVAGYAKGFGYKKKQVFKSANHAWNLVKIDGEWKIFDATWGEGYGEKDKRGKLKSVKQPNDIWFAIDPYDAIYTHLPLNPEYALVNPVIEKRAFEKMEVLDFRHFDLGFDKIEVYKTYCSYPDFDVPRLHIPYLLIDNVIMPRDITLESGKKYQFKFTVLGATELFLFVSRDEEYIFEKKGATFELIFTPKKKGRIVLYYKTDLLKAQDGFKPKKYYPLAEYYVKE